MLNSLLNVLMKIFPYGLYAVAYQKESAVIRSRVYMNILIRFELPPMSC